MESFPTPFVGGDRAASAEPASRRELAPPFYVGGAMPTTEAATPAPAEPESVRAAPEIAGEPLAISAEPAPVDRAEAAGEDDTELPDFLLGPDGAEEEAEAPEPPPSEPPEAPVFGSVEALAEKAQELLEGERGDRLRSLIAELTGFPAEDAVVRAFAAGYLSAKAKEED